MFVATKLAKIKAASLFVASPSAYARAAVAAIGYEVSHIISYHITAQHISVLCFSSVLNGIFFTFTFTPPFRLLHLSYLSFNLRDLSLLHFN
jgi:hypothetical protein